jgi:hypothetical protein
MPQQQPYRQWPVPSYRPYSPGYRPYPPAGALIAGNRINGPFQASRFTAQVHKPTDAALQQQFPGHYARLANPNPVSDTLHNLHENWETLNKLTNNLPAKDHQLAGLSDNVKMGGSLLIATLATLGLKQRIFGIGEFLGFASWFGAMAATPRIINGMVQWKTGVNLNQMYDSTYGQRLNLFNDPHYLPLHILPDAAINRAADKLGIPRGPNRRQQTEDKMRQISVQSHTWWMLVAGPATPVISGLACDALQNPVTRLVNHVKTFWTRGIANLAIENPDRSRAQVAERTRAYLDQLLGELPESQLSGWWKAFGKGIIKETGLGLDLSIKDVTQAGRDEQIEKLVDFFKNNPQPDSVFAYLNGQYKPATATSNAKGTLEKLRETAEQYLKRAKHRLSKQAYEEQKQLIDTRILNAESTVNHYRHLLAAARNGASKTELKALMCDTNINAVQRLLNEGHFAKAEKLVGDANIFQKISASLSNEARQFDKAFKLMGASPEKHLLDDALKNMKLGNLWRRRMGLYLGGGMLLATAIYSYFFVGKDFNSSRNTEGMRL